MIDTLGPGRRSVVWVQGCSIGCTGCIVPELWGERGGTWVDPLALVAGLLDGDPGDLTVSGGEPTEQAAAVAVMLGAARQRGRTTWVYSGRRVEDLAAEGDDDVLSMLSLTDVLVDGPYDRAVAGGAGYRGSRNQRIIRLTGAISERDAFAGQPGKIELRLGCDDVLTLIGIPEPGTLPRLQAGLAERGITMNSGNWR